jgi:hypothetical protein
MTKQGTNMIIDSSKRITFATVKSFVKKALAKDSFYVMRYTSFDGMCDSVIANKTAAIKFDSVDLDKQDFGTNRAIWFVRGGGDYFKFMDLGSYYGIEVYNCCGCSVLLTKKD